MAGRSEPVRSCVGCRQTKPKRTLIRLVRTPAGLVVPDPKGKENGRGAYLCATAACWDAARRRKALERGLDVRLSAPDWDRLQQASAIIRA